MALSVTNNAKVGDPLSLWIIPVADLGGVARHVLDVVREGIPGYRLAVLCPEGPIVQRLKNAGVQVAVGKFGPDAGFSRSVRTLRAAVSRLKPAVVHSHLSYADVIVAATPMPRGVLRVTTEHGIAGDDRIYHGNTAKSRLMAAVHSTRLRRFDAAIAVAEATKQAMIEKWSPKQEINVILNGVDPVEAVPRERGGPLRVLALARLSPEKRIQQLLRAFKLVIERKPDARLTVAGVGELDAELKALAVELGVDHSVSFPGFVDPDAAMAEADVLAQLSVWENCSYSLLDAANRGMRVVASRVGGNPEIVDPRGLVDADDVQSVATALLDETAITRLDAWPTVGDMTTAIADVYASEGGGAEPGALPKHVAIATNNGDIGGGEVMLLSLAQRLSSLGISVRIVGPSQPGNFIAAARAQGADVIELTADSRLAWMRALRRWRRTHSTGILWCNGLVPAAATAGLRNRIVHLHQLPRGAAQRLLASVAGRDALATIVPSAWMRRSTPGAVTLANWTEDLGGLERKPQKTSHTVIGFLGRPSTAKGVNVLAEAVQQLTTADPGAFRLRIGGESYFVSGAERRAVERALKPLGRDVDRQGWVEKRAFFAEIDLLVVPSVWPESFGLVVAEAMSAGVPVIVSDAGALPEVLGLEADVFPAGDSRALADAILRKRDTGLRADVPARRLRWEAMYSTRAADRRLTELLGALDRDGHV